MWYTPYSKLTRKALSVYLNPLLILLCHCKLKAPYCATVRWDRSKAGFKWHKADVSYIRSPSRPDDSGAGGVVAVGGGHRRRGGGLGRLELKSAARQQTAAAAFTAAARGAMISLFSGF